VAILGVFIATGTGLIRISIPVTDSSYSSTSSEPSESSLSRSLCSIQGIITQAIDDGLAN
ncbi:hypothetical protein Tco_0932790, partial [Tanacetum coccineum]